MSTLALALLASICAPARAAANPAAVIVISIDDLRADHLGAYGYPKPVSPRLDAFAREGVVFTEAFSVGTWTRPSNMSLFTSVYPERTGAESQSGRMAPDLITMAQALREAGYRTGGFVSTVNLFPGFGFNRGFEVYEATNTWGDVWAAMREKQRQALDWAAARRRQPFFLFLHYYTLHYSMDPRAPLYAAPADCLAALGAADAPARSPRAALIAMPRYEAGRLVDYDGKAGAAQKRTAEQLYDASISCTDRMLGGFFDELKHLGVYDRALIVVLSDHGEGLFDHGLLSHGTVYDDVLHVPLIVRYPDGQKAGARVSAQARSIDVLPTILEAAGVRPSADLKAQMRGASLRPLIDSKGQGRELCAETEVENVWLYALRRPDGWKLIENSYLRTRALYDLRADPGETRDVFRLHPDVAGDLEERLTDCLDPDG